MRKYLKKSHKKFTRKFAKKGAHLNKKMTASKDLIVYMSPQQMPFPPRYRTKLQCDLQGYVTSATAASGNFYFLMNSIYLPAASGGFPNSSPAIASLLPTGYSSLLNAHLYQRFRVFASKITVQVVPSAQADTVNFTITPSNAAGTPSVTYTAMAQPYTTSRLCQSNQKSFVKNFITQHKLEGVPKKAIEDDLSGNYEGSYATQVNQPRYWNCNWSTVDAVNTTTPLLFVVRLEYFVEMWSDTTGTLLES